MRKEVILAIVIGVILGGIVLYGLKIANQTVESQKLNSTEVTPTPTTTPTPTPADFITIDTPTDHSVSFTSTISIKGKTRPLTAVAISGESADEITESDAQGNFTSDVVLVGGENVITASIPQTDGTVTSKTITVIYTSSVIEN